MGKICLFIYDNMADFEISLLVHLLVSECEKEIEIVASQQKLIKSMSGMLFVPHKTIDEVNFEEIEGIVIPGGELKILEDSLIDLLHKLLKSNKFIGAVCFAPWILAKAGILEGYRYTTSITEWKDEHRRTFGIEDPFPREGFCNQRVVTDRNIITAKGSAFLDFAFAVCDYFGGEDRKMERMKLYGEMCNRNLK